MNPDPQRVAAWMLYNLLREGRVGDAYADRKVAFQGPVSQVERRLAKDVLDDLLKAGHLIEHKGTHLSVNPRYLANNANDLLEALDPDRERVLRERLPRQYVPDPTPDEDPDDPGTPRSLEERVTDLERDLEAARDHRTNLSSKVDELEDALADLDGDVKTILRRLGKLEGRRVEALESTLEDLEPTIEQLEGLVEALEGWQT